MESEIDERGLRVDEQLTKLVARLRPYQDKLAALSNELKAEEPSGALWVGAVRFYDDEEGEEESEREAVGPDGTTFERLPGQHQLLGWHLDTDTLTFMISLSAELDIDEYG